ncbi:TetR/AcrR family transcriptional regulator [Bradyrhizobium sp. Tv2a-2]|uniref:TetR/AcrR family transcriptional regulator n=1 Tax=Bradyrhizobium sp. Tv2a-2 TaxID=113395 RepID=UPI00040A1518|nr:TetR/AcrR family transcriptional regulator [Bradyrhizobium sp. Tv2a-2]
MARTRSENYDDIQAGILRNAARLFATRGYERSSVGDLVEACELSRGAIYHYFDSKEAILFAMLDSLVRSLLANLEQAVADGGAPLETFVRVIEAFVEHNARSPEEQIVLLNDLGALQAEEQRQIVQTERKIVELVGKVLVSIDATKKMNRRNARVYTMMLFGMINYTYTWYDAKGPIKPKEFAQLAANLFLKGFLAES